MRSPLSPLRIGLVGLGTVGQAVFQQIRDMGKYLKHMTNREFVITAVCARDKTRDRGIDLSSTTWFDDPIQMASDPDIDLIVELIGGQTTALTLTKTALQNGKPVVSANKALIAQHGQMLALTAERTRTDFRFEAAVAGAIPIISTLLNALQGNEITRILGVMNGTCNYILTEMLARDLPYQTVYNEAKAKGYLEADPTLDTGGIDTSHKLAILSAIAFHHQVALHQVSCTGIDEISIDDIRFADDLGYRVKLLGVSMQHDGRVEQHVYPALVPTDSPLGMVGGPTNMIVIEGPGFDRICLQGPGAGGSATASAIVSDIVNVVKTKTPPPPFGEVAINLKRPMPPSISLMHNTAYYIRMSLADQPGSLAKVTQIFGAANISIDRMHQYGVLDGGSTNEAKVIIITHPASRKQATSITDQLNKLDIVTKNPIILPIE